MTNTSSSLSSASIAASASTQEPIAPSCCSKVARAALTIIKALGALALIGGLLAAYVYLKMTVGLAGTIGILGVGVITIGYIANAIRERSIEQQKKAKLQERATHISTTKEHIKEDRLIEALREINKLEAHDRARDLLLLEVAAAYCTAGSLQAAFDVAQQRQTHNDETADNFYLQLANAHIQKLALQKAYEIVGCIDNITIQKTLLLRPFDTLKGELRDQDCAYITQIINQIKSGETKDVLLHALADTYLRQGKRVEALDIVGCIDNITIQKTLLLRLFDTLKGELRDQDCVYITQIINQIKSGEIKDVLLHALADTYLRQGKLVEALDMTKEISLDSSKRETLLKKLYEAAPDPNFTFSVLKAMLPSQSLRNLGLARLAQALIEQNQLDDAETVVNAMHFGSSKALMAEEINKKRTDIQRLNSNMR